MTRAGEVTTTAGAYRQLIGQLADLASRVEAQRVEADDWYDRQRAAADRAVDSAQQAVDEATSRLAAARESAERVEAATTHLWQALRVRLRLSAARTGPPPAPATGAPTGAHALLDGVRALIDKAGRRGDLPAAANPVLVLLGVLGSVLAAAAGVAIRVAGVRHGGDLRVGLPVVGLVVTLLGPVVGLAPARLVADRRHATLGPRPMAVAVIAGALTTAVLVAVLR